MVVDYQDLYKRLDQTESRINQLIEQWKKKKIQEKIENDLRKKQVWHYRFYRVPRNYYDFTLEERASLLGGNVPQLCKSIVFENTVCDHDNITDITNSRYYLVIVQYISKINPTLLRNFVHSLKPSTERLSKNSFNFQLANEEDSNQLSGFEHNAITPYGMNSDLPVIIDSRLLEVKPSFIYLGGGFVDVKLFVSLPDLIESLHAKVGLITDPR